MSDKKNQTAAARGAEKKRAWGEGEWSGKGLEGCLNEPKDDLFGLVGETWGILIWLHIASDMHNTPLTVTATSYFIPKP